MSDSLLFGFKGLCEAFHYVRIKYKGKEGIVDGRKVFRILDSAPAASLRTENNHIEIFPTEFFGVGIANHDGLTGCPVDQPVVIRDSANNYFGLIYQVKNEFAKKAGWGSAYPFFELKDDDGGHDNIDDFFTEGTKMKIKIRRGFQEGENQSDVSLHYENGKYTAEYLNFGEIMY